MKKFWNDDPSVKIKICGVESAEYAYDIYDLGVHAIGYHLWNHEIYTNEFDRKLKVFNQLSSLLPKDLSKFLLTDISDPVIIKKIISNISFDTLQFHSFLSIGNLQNLFSLIRQYNSSIKLVSVISLNKDEYIEDLLELAVQYSKISDAILLDSSWKGGSGIENNWNLASEIRQHIAGKLILAGGINPNNIRTAYNTVRPFALDIQSSVERVVIDKNQTIKLKSVNYTDKLISALRF
jgi:phosphoribosylanthranilate isomerase